MGSSDGLLGFSAGHVLVRGRRAPVLAVSLEHTRLDLTGIDDAEAGDEVVIIGGQADDAITVREVFQLHNLATPAAVPSLVGARIDRRYAGAVPALVGAAVGRDGA
jgi:alanine racemase